MDALVCCPPSFGCYTKAAKTRWLNCSPFVNAKIKCKSLPGTSSYALLHQTLTQTNAFVPWPESRPRGSSWFSGTMANYVLVLLVRLCLLILVILLSNQKANILGGVGHGRFLLVLKILCCHLLSIITTACGEGQTLLLVNVKHSTNLHHLMTEVGVNDDDGRADWLCHVSRNGQQIVRSISP